uniref:Uncharacterized protein n=1 Tax=Musca domestica TaxID=7370 RepID=A0A1I8MX26_MUSDO
MKSFRLLAVVCLVVATVSSAPVDQSKPNNDLFAGILGFAQLGNPPKESELVKRRIYEENHDRELKQISLQSLINNMEDSLFASAFSVHNVAHDPSAVIPEIRPEGGKVKLDHDVNKRNLIAETTTGPSVETTTLIPVEGEERKVVLQTTERVPESAGVPAHIIIDRIAIQPHHGNFVPLIPAFEIKHTRTANGEKVPEVTRISISKTEITSVPNAASTTAVPTTSSPETTTAATTATSTTSSTEATTTSTDNTSTTLAGTSSTTTATETTPTTSTPTTSSTTAVVATKETESTTAKNIEQLKEEEQELKEKVAEIEAEPIILSARV